MGSAAVFRIWTKVYFYLCAIQTIQVTHWCLDELVLGRDEKWDGWGWEWGQWKTWGEGGKNVGKQRLEKFGISICYSEVFWWPARLTKGPRTQDIGKNGDLGVFWRWSSSYQNQKVARWFLSIEGLPRIYVRETAQSPPETTNFQCSETHPEARHVFSSEKHQAINSCLDRQDVLCI